VRWLLCLNALGQEQANQTLDFLFSFHKSAGGSLKRKPQFSWLLVPGGGY